MSTDTPARPNRAALRRGGLVLWLTAALVIAATGGLAVFAWARAGEADRPVGAGADLVPAARASFDVTTTATGELQARTQIEIRNRVESQTTITEIVAEGTRVKKGDVLVRLNSDQIKNEIDEDMLSVESARAELIAAENAYEIQKSENESKLRQAKLKVDLARLSLDQWREGEHKQKLKDIELALDSTLKELERLEEKFQRSEDLYRQGFLSKNERDLDEIALRKARAEREKALLEEVTYLKYQMPKDERQKLSDLGEAEAELERVARQNEIELASKEADRVNRRRQLQMRQERLAREQEQLEFCTITAPQDGLVVYWGSTRGSDFYVFDGRGPLQVGRQVMPQEPLIALPDTSAMHAVVRVHESLAGRIRPGLPATIKVEALGNRTFRGTVDSVGIMAESGGWRDPNRREYTVKIAVDVPDAAEAGLKPSMRCEAEIQLDRVEGAVAVPIQAVFNDGAVRYIYTPRGGKFARVPVKIGRRSETYAEILAGIDAGKQVLLRRPTASEIIREPWDAKQLELVGLVLDKNGQPALPDAPDGPGAARTIAIGGPGGAATVHVTAAGGGEVQLPAGAVIATPAGAGESAGDAASEAPAAEAEPAATTAAAEPGGSAEGGPVIENPPAQEAAPAPPAQGG